jgi:hypothetical protein
MAIWLLLVSELCRRLVPRYNRAMAISPLRGNRRLSQVGEEGAGCLEAFLVKRVVHCLAPYLPLCPLGAERAGVRWGLHSAGNAHLTLPLLRNGPLPLPQWAERAFQFSSDDFEHAGEIMHDVIVPEADDAIAATRDLQGAGCVFLLLLRVLTAVEFDRELAAGTGEIDDMRSDRMLPPKAVLARKLAQSQPHLFLGFRRSPPQALCNPCPPFQCQAMPLISLSAP